MKIKLLITCAISILATHAFASKVYLSCPSGASVMTQLGLPYHGHQPPGPGFKSVFKSDGLSYQLTTTSTNGISSINSLKYVGSSVHNQMSGTISNYPVCIYDAGSEGIFYGVEFGSKIPYGGFGSDTGWKNQVFPGMPSQYNLTCVGSTDQCKVYYSTH